ncbi:negative regulation of autophagosome assembly [Homalodisca vitripennis]|nr:negative regulation of autophagosome assembly [Homalodisca vitripennis]
MVHFKFLSERMGHFDKQIYVLSKSDWGLSRLCHRNPFLSLNPLSVSVTSDVLAGIWGGGRGHEAGNSHLEVARSSFDAVRRSIAGGDCGAGRHTRPAAQSLRNSLCARPCIMRDSATKMAELKFEAPLAQFEETDEWGVTEFHHSKPAEDNAVEEDANSNIAPEELITDAVTAELCDNANKCVHLCQNDAASVSSVADNFTETFSGSLEDLVNTFDDKITKCFCNYDESVEKLAPVQVRTQEEIMNECQ